jgi:cobalamin biosynthesis protein CobT
MTAPKKRKKRTITTHTIKSLMERTSVEGDCIEWLGYSYEGNNPQVSQAGKMVSVRKLVMLLSGRKLPDRAYYKTTCGNDLCVRLEHIKVVDTKKHMISMAKKVMHNAPTRVAKLQASAINRRKLTDEQVQDILLSSGSSRQLGAQYGVSASTISKIKSHQTRRSVSASVNPFAGLMR